MQELRPGWVGNWARYWPEEERLEIDFRYSGKAPVTYSYSEFPPIKWAEMKEAKNHATFFAEQIRFAKKGDVSPLYPFKKVK